MNDEFFLNVSSVEISTKKIISYIEKENSLIEELSNLLLRDVDTCYRSTLNKDINLSNSNIISKLNNIYKEDLDNYMSVKNDLNNLVEIKRSNISSTIAKEGKFN